MSSIVVVGSQWGDEGKGKITDFLSQDADIVARYQGGDNAGHSIVFNGQQFSLQLIPSGIFFPEKTCVIGNGVVVNPVSLMDELKYLHDNGISTDNLRISDRANVIFPYHRLQDEYEEEMKTEKIGTTHKGIGPAYMDKAERIGIRMVDLLDQDIFAAKLQQNLTIKNRLFDRLYDKPTLKFDEIFNQYYAIGQQLKPFITDTSVLVNDALANGQHVLFEGAQGVMLDVDHGTYPFVTSSNPVAGGVTTGLGIGPSLVNEVIGVCKAYTSRVGDGPFPTEQINEIGDQIRETAHEYGTVTHRPRRIGWFDSVCLRHATRVSGFTRLSLNCLDVLTGIPTLKVCVAYDLDGQRINHYPASLAEIDRCRPIYEELPGWTEDITQCRRFEDLPDNAQHYLTRISKLVGVPYLTFSVGPDRDQTNILASAWQ
ncbi:adenylosuccinate synthase [Levilactobacillus bambusae]|uniref:Adenylosuccinate synthetase n=1 Tax=Levilactobacillus bambusae TaxID=2024736 RepID=A0A2V1N055_9LACO|nr:adenylosuccinate synthase [Levilactobacillus bambusae]PWF99804.1 adenylosuccinate synthase [Levilactobacillus bambusae]